MTDTPRFTMHARRRFIERFPTLDQDVEWLTSRRVGKNLRRKIRAACPSMSKIMAGRTFRGYYYTVSPLGVIFVVGSGTGEPVIVTVLNRFDLEQHAKEINS